MPLFLAVNGGPYVTYTLGYMGTVLIVSPFASVLVVSTPLVGLPVGVVAGGLLGLALNITTMRFVADIDPESPSAGEWAGQHAGDRTVDSENRSVALLVQPLDETDSIDGPEHRAGVPTFVH